MKKIRTLSMIIIAAMVFFAAGPGRATAQTDKDEAISSLIKTDQAFAALTEQRGPRDGFLTYLGDTSVIFKPGPVEGRSYYQQADPGKLPSLNWTAEIAGVSGACDLGFTVGSYESKKGGTNYGHYVSVWGKDQAGAWKVLVDIGIGHERRDAVRQDIVRISPSGPADALAPEAMKKASNSLRDQAAAFNKAVSGGGYLAALRDFATSDIRILHAGDFPVAGLEEAKKILKPNEGKEAAGKGRASVSLQDNTTMYALTAASGDLGVTYGSINPQDPKRKDSTGFLWIWQNQGGKWRICLAVIDPIKS